MPALGQVHIDQALTNLSIQYANMMYVADQVFPTLPVGKRSNKYYIYSPAMMVTGTATDANGKPLSLRRPKTRAAELDFSLSTDNYYCEEYALAELVSDAEVAYADNPLQPDQDATLFLTNRIALDNEIQVANLVGNTAKYGSANKKTLVSGAGTNPGDSSWKATGQANSDPFANFTAARLAVIKSLFQEPNTMLLTIDSAQYLSQHPKYVDRYKYVSKEGINEKRLVLPVVNGLNVIEGGAQKATNAEGQALVTGNVWVDSGAKNLALIFYRGMETGPRSLHFGRTFEAPDDTSGARGWSVRRYRDEPRKGSVIEVSTLRDWKLVAVDGSGLSLAGYLLSDVTA
jgi:hypothetical protein